MYFQTSGMNILSVHRMVGEAQKNIKGIARVFKSVKQASIYLSSRPDPKWIRIRKRRQKLRWRPLGQRRTKKEGHHSR